MAQAFLGDFCGYANGSWFLTKYFVDVDNHMFTHCGEAVFVSFLQTCLLINVIINAWMIPDRFYRFSEDDKLPRYYWAKIVLIATCLIILLVSFVISFFNTMYLPLVIRIEEAFIIFVWSIMIAVWGYSLYHKSITRKGSLTFCQFIASKGIMLMCGQRARVYGPLAPQSLLIDAAAIVMVLHNIVHWIEKSEIRYLIGSSRLDGYDVLERAGDESASRLSKLFFVWTNGLIGRGGDDRLHTIYDLYELPPSLEVENVEAHFVESSPTFFTDGEKFSVYRSLIKAFGFEFFCLAILRLLADTFAFFGPILLRLLVEALELPIATDEGILLALAVTFCTFMSAMINTHFNFYVNKIGMKVKTALITAIYDKLLRVRYSDVYTSSGQIINYVSTDVDRVVNFCNSFHQFWAMPMQMLVALIMLYKQVGAAFSGGLLVCAILLLANRYITIVLSRMSKKFMHWKDERIKLVQEMVENIRTIKASNLEKFFFEKIERARERELYYLKIRKYLDAVCVYVWASAPLLIQISIFTIFVYVLERKMTAAVVYPVIALISMLIMPLNAFPWVVNGMIEAWVSIGRLEEFFSHKNIDYQEVYCQNDERRILLQLRLGTFYWEYPENPQISDFTLIGGPGHIIGITGDVGCGKSTLLMGLLGETKFPEWQQIGITQDSMQGITYVGQERWLSRGTIRDNILMGKPFKEELYKTVLIHSCLKNDLNNFPGGDEYVISENGATLSGGQRTRVVIARALYQNTAIYLFDEPFASLDSNVARRIFQLGIRTLKARGKLVIIASHDIVKLCECDHIIKLTNRGTAETQGHPSQVFPNEYNKMMMTAVDEDITAETDFTERVFEQEEEKQVGAVKANVYWTYFESMGCWLSILIACSLAFMQFSKNFSDWWLSHWTSQTNSTGGGVNLTDYFLGNYEIEEYEEDEERSKAKYFLFIYGLIALGNTAFTLMRAFLFAIGGLRAAKELHTSLLRRLLHTAVLWWERTPSGRIVNRLCSDIYTVDENLPFTLNIFLASFFTLVGAIVVSIIGLPWIIPVMLILAYIYNKIQKHYRKTTVELKRICSLTLSPLYSHLSDSVNGLVTIRAHKYVEQYCQKLRGLLTDNMRAQYASTAANQWLNIRLSMIAVFMVGAITVIALIQHRIWNKVDSGLVGLAITYALTLTTILNNLLSSFIETEREMVSVERIDEYTTGDILPEEPKQGYTSFSHELVGRIEFKNVEMCYYKDGPKALDGVNFIIPGGARCAVLGRTGSGKSSIFHALLRTVELKSGFITIDGHDIKNLSLKLLRSIVGYIPQHPFIFNGTFYENLTIFTPGIDANLVRTIVHVAGLDNLMVRLGGLEGMIQEDGGNISYGEKQIISICRVLLFKPKIVLVDEGTSYVDMATHTKMTELLNNHLHHSTIVSIIHNKIGMEGFTMFMEMCSGRPLFYNLTGEFLSGVERSSYDLERGSL